MRLGGTLQHGYLRVQFYVEVTSLKGVYLTNHYSNARNNENTDLRFLVSRVVNLQLKSWL